MVSLTQAGEILSVLVRADRFAWPSAGAVVQAGDIYPISAAGQWRVAPLCPPTGPDGGNIYTLTCWDIGGQRVRTCRRRSPRRSRTSRRGRTRSLPGATAEPRRRARARRCRALLRRHCHRRRQRLGRGAGLRVAGRSRAGRSGWLPAERQRLRGPGLDQRLPRFRDRCQRRRRLVVGSLAQRSAPQGARLLQQCQYLLQGDCRLLRRRTHAGTTARHSTTSRRQAPTHRRPPALACHDMRGRGAPLRRCYVDRPDPGFRRSAGDVPRACAGCRGGRRGNRVVPG